MARYEHLPIYKKSFELAVYLEKTVVGFARRHKYGLGARMRVGAPILKRVGHLWSELISFENPHRAAYRVPRGKRNLLYVDDFACFGDDKARLRELRRSLCGILWCDDAAMAP